MRLRGTIRRIVGLYITLSLLLICGYGCAFGQQAASDAPAAETLGSDWSVKLNDNAVIEIWYKGTPVISNVFVHWGRNWDWAGTQTTGTYGDQGQLKFVSDIPKLKIKMVGEMRSTAPNVLQIDMVRQSELAVPEAMGGGWQWVFKLDSPSFGKRAADPELLPNNQGWTWNVGNGQAITLRTDGRFAKTYFEAGNKHLIRTFFVADRIQPGRQRFQATLELPQGAQRKPTPAERYDRPNPSTWFSAALAPGAAPVDLSFLNRDDRPAGRRGFVRAEGDRLVFADGTPARFWGANVAAYALFFPPRQEVAGQAHRMAQLGYNLMRIHHHDSNFVDPNVFGKKANTTRHLDPRSLESIDWWIKCLKDEGIYIWLDLHVARMIKPLDGLTEGAEEVFRQRGELKGFCYYNSQLQKLMKEFQREYLNHLNRYTNLRYKDDPAIVAVLITNENDMTNHGCYGVLPDKKNPYVNAVWTKDYQAFAQSRGLPEKRVFQTWMPGPSKIHLSDVEHRFNELMIADVRQVGVKAPLATTNFWGRDALFSLPPLTDGDQIDVHSYGEAEELGRNAHYQGTFLGWIAMGQVYGKPISITEWNVEYPNADRFIGPLYVASIASLQGWDAPMLYNYSQIGFGANPGIDKWSTFHDPAITGVMPAAALLFRRGHVSPAKKTYCFTPTANALFERGLNPENSATIRTLAEQSKLTIGMPEVRELPWLKPSQPSGDATIITDPDHDFIPDGQSFVRSDTGELTRDWERGIQTIDTPKTQAVSGWIGGETLRTHDATFETRTKKAVVALTSVDDRPLSESRFVLVTAVARAEPSAGGRPPFLSEPVHCRISLRTRTTDLELLALARDGRVAGRPRFEHRGDELTFELPAARGTHWYLLKSRTRSAQEGSPSEGTDRSSSKR
jgi:Cellulase (glycosyl hydrolase family 5)